MTIEFQYAYLMKFKVEGTNRGHLTYMSRDYARFRTDEPIDSDFDIIVSDSVLDNADCYVLNHEYWVKDNHLFCADRHKIVRWKVCLKDLTQTKTTVHSQGSRFGEVFLRDYILEPLIGLKLAAVLRSTDEKTVAAEIAKDKKIGPY